MMSIYEDNFMEHPKWSLPFLPKLSPNSSAEYFDYHHPPHWTIVGNLILANYSSKWGTKEFVRLTCKVMGEGLRMSTQETLKRLESLHQEGMMASHGHVGAPTYLSTHSIFVHFLSVHSSF